MRKVNSHFKNYVIHKICAIHKFPSLNSFWNTAYTSFMEIRRFPNKLKMFRQCQGFSQKKVARILGLTDTSMLSRWEHGISFPSLIQVFRLSRIYHVQPIELFDQLWNETENNLLVQVNEPFTISQPFYSWFFNFSWCTECIISKGHIYVLKVSSCIGIRLKILCIKTNDND